MPAFLPDSSFMIAAVCTWHGFHQAARSEVEMRLDRKESMVVAGPALVETYSVLTRLPAPHRLAAEDAVSVLRANFIGGARIVVLAPKEYRALLLDAPARGISGGRIYDAIIAECALRAKVSVLLTFNEPHFVGFEQRGLQIVVPGTPGP